MTLNMKLIISNNTLGMAFKLISSLIGVYENIRLFSL